MKLLLPAIRICLPLLIVFTLLLGVAYPLIVGGFAQAFFPSKAHGSLIQWGDHIVGSKLLGQSFDDPKYFWGRLSATTPPYNAASSSASNLSPANPALLDAANARIAALQQADPGNHNPIPVELITASGSGLDPHISLAAAEYQLPRVARLRHRSPQELEALLEHYTEGRDLLFFGTSYVNVLRLNMALDEEGKKQ